MELLEREGALATLARARETAGRGTGRVAFVTGEPGIGKTSLVTHFLGELDEGTRALVGTCDDLAIPRPLGPIRDLAGRVSPALVEALSSGAAPHEIQSLLISELERPPPTVLVIEDVHWADDATLDVITVLGRRIATLPVLMILTFRSGEAPPRHPLYATLAGIRADDAVVIELTPLSAQAVAALAGDDADRVFAATGGNPFYVTELLAIRPADELPPSVANAVRGRTSRLDEPSRRLVELVSVVPSRVSASLLDVVMPDWAAAAVEPERLQLLQVDPAHVRFRHELARHAIRQSVPIARRRSLHAVLLGALRSAGADPADIVHHAEAAGADDVLAEFAIVAARRASALGSNREAHSHYRRAADFIDRLAPAEQAAVLEERAQAAYLVNRLDDAFPAIERATRIFGDIGDREAVGRCTRVLSRLHWFAGDGAAARAKGRDAVAILEPLGESVELARAYSGLSQLAMLEQDPEQTFAWGERALDLAGRLGDESTRAHALINIGIARSDLDPEETATLLEAHAIADAAGDPHEATRALGNLGFTLMRWMRPDAAFTYARRALEYAQEHEVHNLASYLVTMVAWLRLRAGEWDEAERVTRGELERGITVVQLLAKTVLTELAVRRGDSDAPDRLSDLAAHAERTAELQRIAPALELAAEWALTTGAPMPVESIARLAEEIHSRGVSTGWGPIRVAAWGAVAGLDVRFDQSMPAAYAAMCRRDWRGAADAFGAVGWDYDRALMLSLLDEEPALVEAIAIARALGAEPLTRRVAGRMRMLGMRVPQGPREATRANPAGLTARQLEVLELLAAGLTNAEIADRLVVSARTAEHHVGAVLAKIGAATRRDVSRRAVELGLLLPEG